MTEDLYRLETSKVDKNQLLDLFKKFEKDVKSECKVSHEKNRQKIINLMNASTSKVLSSSPYENV